MRTSGSGTTRRAFGLSALARLARAEAGAVRFSKQYGLPYLAMMVMEHERPVEAQAAQQLDGLLAGAYDFITPGVPTLGTIWDKTVGTGQEVRALCALQSMPYVLVTRNPAVATLADFTDADRIAARGEAHGARPHPRDGRRQAVGRRRVREARRARRHPAAPGRDGEPALEQRLRGQPPVRLAVLPLRAGEPAHPPRAQVLRHDRQARERRPDRGQGLPRAEPGPVRGAVFGAGGGQRLHPQPTQQAAEIYIARAGDKRSSPAEMAKMVADPDNDWTTTPAQSMTFASFMHKVGRTKYVPASWKDLFMPEAQGLTGT